MTEAVVRLWLKVTDPTALTARETLQRALGYGRHLRAAARSQIWAFRWDEAVDARELLGRLAVDTNLLLNPNKHLYRIAVDGEPVEPRGNAWVLVWVSGEGNETEDVLRRHRLLPGTPPRILHGVLWELDLDAAEVERERLAGEIAVTRERGKGLLANPHVEDARVFIRPPTAAELVRTLAGTTGAGRVG